MELEAQFEPNGGGGGGAVDSVNGQTGTVVLDAGDLEYDDEETYSAGSVGAELTSLKGGLSDLNEDLTNIQTGTSTDIGKALSPKTVSDGKVTEWQYVATGGGGSSPSPYTSNPAALGTASPGSSDAYARGDHVHPKPTASDLGITVPSASSATPQALGTAAAGSSSDYSRADHVHAKPTASDIGASPAVTEVTVATDGAVTQALDAGKIYHFTGTLTALTITLNAAASGQLAEYHFDFNCGSTAPTVTIPQTVTMPDSQTFDTSKHYEVDILNNYGVVISWGISA